MTFFSFYRHLKSALNVFLLSLGLPPHSCRYSPSCSRYCEQAVVKYGAFKGFTLCVGRLFRCNPLFRGGFDPLP